MQINEQIAAVIKKYRSHPQFIGMEVGDPNQPGAMGDTMLHFAAEMGDVEDIEVLVAAGARVNVVGDIGNTPLHGAALMGKVAAVQKLLQLGADTRIKNEFGETALDVAKTGGHTAVSEVLEEK